MEHRLRYRLRAFEEELPAVAAFLDGAGWSRVDDDWRLFWDTDLPGAEEFAEAGERLYNHLPGTDVLGVKSLLATALETARVRAEERGRGEEYDFFPRTYLLPDDFSRLQRAAERMPGATWIRKPKNLSRGRGVEVLASAGDAGLDPEHLVQEYIASPHLIDGHKYSLRCYVLVTSLEPLVAWLFHDGFTKLASRPFSLRGDEKLDRFRHLTNPDVLKEDKTVQTSSKNLTHAGYRARLRGEGHDDARLFSRIRAIAQKTLVAARDAIVREGRGLGQAHRFEMFGFDIAVDERLSAWLIECNTSPSLAIAAEGDTQAVRDERDVKHRVSRDLIALLGLNDAPAPWPADERALAEVVRAQTARAGGFERIFPTLETAPLLGDFEQPAPRDVALAAALGLLPPLSARGARAFPLGDGLVLASEQTGFLANLNGAHAALWNQLTNSANVGIPIVGIQTVPALSLDGDGADRIAAWLFDRFLGVEPPAPARPGLRAWNAQPGYQLGDYRFALRTPGAEARALLEDAFAPLRSGAPGAAPRAWDVVRHLDGFAIHDPRGQRRWRGELEQVAHALAALVRGEAALVSGELGWLDAALVQAGRAAALVLLPPGGARSLFAHVGAHGLALAASPVHLRAHERLIASPSPSAPGLTPALLVQLVLDPRSAPREAPLSAFDAMSALSRSGPEELRADPAHAAALVDWLAETARVELSAQDGPSAAAALHRLLAEQAARGASATR